MSQIGEKNGLESVSVSAGPEQWDQQDELRISVNSLIVADDRFWFQAYSEQGMFNVETQGMPVGELVRVAQAGHCVAVTTAGIFNDNFLWHDGVLYFGNLPEDLVDQFVSCYQLGATEGVDQ